MIHVLRPGLLSTVQDLGRTGYQRYGIVAGGAADPLAARVANVLVGNPENAALIEMALVGPQLRFDSDALVAWCGAAFPATLNGAPLPRNRPVRVTSGSKLNFFSAPRGAMAWLAVAGGIAVPAVLKSRSTDLAARFGGLGGRGLKQGDLLPIGPATRWAESILARLAPSEGAGWSVSPEHLGRPARQNTLRVLRGPEWDWFSAEAQTTLFDKPFEVTKESNRMGIRFTGPSLTLREPREMVSAAVNHGVLQVPPSGQPILLGADRQTLGGYPRIAGVVTVDCGRIAQLRPGETIRFQEISLAEAHGLLLDRERDFRRAAEYVSRLAL